MYKIDMDELKKLIEKLGGKKEAAEKLGISMRMLYYILEGKRKPGKHLLRWIRFYLID